MIAFATLALVGLIAALVGTTCDEPSLDCLHLSGRTAARAGIVGVPIVAYIWYRISRGGPRG